MENNASNLKETAYDFIKEKLLTCEIYPGQSISEKQIAETLGIGRTPIREALLMLQKENLIDIYPRRGTCAKRIIASDMIELYQIRKLIEPVTATQYKGQIDILKLQDFERRFMDNYRLEPLNEQNDYTLDAEFHQYLVDVANNSRLSLLFRNVQQEMIRVGLLSAKLHLNNPRENTLEQHRGIIRSILMENDREISESIREHLNTSMLISLETIRVADSATAAGENP